MTVDAIPLSAKERGDLTSGLVDCDVHPLTQGDVSVIYPYMTQAWVKRFQSRHLISDHRALFAFRYVHPGGTLRAESKPPRGGEPGSDPDFLRHDLLDRFGHYRALLLPLQPAMVPAWSDALEAATLTAAYNRYFIEEWLPRDERFRLAIVVAPQAPELAANEIRELGGDPRIAAVWVPMLNILAGNRYFHPIYEAAAEVGLPIVFHPTGAETTYVGAPMFAGGIPSMWIEKYTLYMQLAESNVVSLVFEGVFERYPTLTTTFVEFGFSWLPSWMWRMDQAWRAGRVDVPWVRELPSEYIRRHVRFTTEPLDEPPRKEMLAQILDMVFAQDTLMFASDYPHWDSDDPRRVMTRLPESIRQVVARDTALKTFPRME